MLRRTCAAGIVLFAVVRVGADEGPRPKPLTETTVPPGGAEEPARRLPAVVTVCQDAARGCWSEVGEHDCRSAATPAATVFRVVIAGDGPEALAACKAPREQR